MSGFTMRRFVLQNITAVAAHCPSTTVSAAAMAVMTGAAPAPAADGSTASPSSSAAGAGWVQRMLVRGQTDPADAGGAGAGRFGLMTEAEMEWVRRRRREEADESRVVLATRPSRSLLRGVGGAALNSVVGFVVSPLVLVAVSLERLRLGTTPLALGTAPFYGLLWGGIFFACAQYAAAQQVVLSAYYGGVAAPLYYCTNRRPALPSGCGAVPASSARARAWVWNGLACRYEAPQGAAGAHHPLLHHCDDAATMRERAMKRVSRREKDSRKRTARYEGKRGVVGDEDYYGLLGLSPDATARQVKEAYTKMALHIHPDRNPSPDAAQQFDRVTKAYRVLSNPLKRKKFDLGGAKGVDNTGAKKREALRAVFGGEEMHRLMGDVFLGSFAQRVTDGLDYLAEELAVQKQRMYEQCRDELLKSYLAHYDPAASADVAPRGSSGSSGPWRGGTVAVQLRKLLNVGLAKEVLHAVGHEYRRVVAYFDMEATKSAAGAPQPVALPSLALSRARFYLSIAGPHRWRVQRRKLKYLASLRGQTFKNSEAMVDLVWYTSAAEVEATARTVALMVLYDPQLPPAEVARRRDALAALADTFVQYGQPYKGASKATLDQLMNSMRDYQQQQQRERDAQ